MAWRKVQESGLLLPEDSVATWLYVAGTLGAARGVGLGAWRPPAPPGDAAARDGAEGGDVAADDDRARIPEEIATYHDLASKPTEASVSLRVKALAAQGDARGAEALL